MEQLTPQQETDYNNAWQLANQANDAFNERHKAATKIAEAAIGSEVKGLKAAFAQADQGFRLYESAAEALMPGRGAFETSIPTEFEYFASETVWNAMSLEQKVKASEARKVIAERFQAHGVTSESLRVVQHETEEGKKVFTLVHTGNGVDIGNPTKDFDKARSYNSVMAKKNNDLFNVQVGGITYDTREGMTDAAYDALVADAKAQEGSTLPDSQEAAKENNDLWTWTMLTGEPLTAAGYVQVRYVYGGGVRGSVDLPDDDYRGLRVRPAVVIE